MQGWVLDIIIEMNHKACKQTKLYSLQLTTIACALIDYFLTVGANGAVSGPKY